MAPEGCRKLAYVVLVMSGDAYVPGALLTAFTIGRADGPSRRADLVCMVTSDVSESARASLALVYDRVVEVPLIEAPVRRMHTAKQEKKYGGWSSKAFTKWNCLSFTEYDRIIFMDADTLVVSSIDELFDVATPAGTFSSPWAIPYARNGRTAGMRNPYKSLRHLDAVPDSAIRDGLDGAFVVIGTTVVLTPSLDDFNRIKEILKETSPFGSSACNSGMDEQLLVSLYLDLGRSWTYIHQLFNFIPWHRQWLCDADRPPRVFHFFSDKPWTMPRASWPDLELFWECVQALVADRASCAAYFNADDLAARLEVPTCDWCKQGGKKDIAHFPLDETGRLTCPDLSAEKWTYSNVNAVADVKERLTKVGGEKSARHERDIKHSWSSRDRNRRRSTSRDRNRRRSTSRDRRRSTSRDRYRRRSSSRDRYRHRHDRHSPDRKYKKGSDGHRWERKRSPERHRSDRPQWRSDSKSNS